MGRKKRVRKGTQRKMHKRMVTGKKPMSAEQKEARKKIRETQRNAQLEKNKANKK